MQPPKRTEPIKWFDLVTIDPESEEGKKLRRGMWKDMIPTNGEVGVSIPQEDFTFDKISREELDKVWVIE